MVTAGNAKMAELKCSHLYNFSIRNRGRLKLIKCFQFGERKSCIGQNMIIGHAAAVDDVCSMLDAEVSFQKECMNFGAFIGLGIRSLVYYASWTGECR
jgi:hypothetical protein